MAGKNNHSDTPDPRMAEAVNAHASSWMKRGLALLNENTPASLAQAVQCFERAIELRRGLPIWQNPVYRYALAAGWSDRGEALTRLGGVENLVRAMDSHGHALPLLRSLPLDNPTYRRRLALGWLARGLTLQSYNTVHSLAESVHSFAQSVAVQRTAPSLEPEDRCLLGCALMNHGYALLHSPDLSAGWDAKHAASQALGMLASLAENDLGAAETDFKARHVLCDAIALLLTDRTLPISARESLVLEATDAADDGMRLARLWEQRGVSGFRPLIQGLFKFGIRIYQAHQPHFLREFVLENLDPALSPGAVPDSREMHAAALTALQRAWLDIQRGGFRTINTPRFERTLETLRDLRFAEARLAELRQLHLQG